MNPPDPTTQTCFDTLIAATAADDYDQFVSVGDERFKTGLKPEAFHRVNQWLGPRLKKGFTPTFLGELRENGYVASLWCLRFDDGGNDLLFKMAIGQGKVVGALVGPTFG